MQAPVQVQQVVQADGTIAEVPIQQRKAKLFTVSVNRFNTRESNKNTGVRKINAGIMVTGIDRFKPFKKVPLTTKSNPYHGIKQVGTIGSCFTPARVGIGLEDVGQSRSLKKVSIGQRPQIDLGLVTAKNTGFTVDGEGSSTIIETTKSENRKSKMTTPKVNMKSALKIGGNINKFLLKKKIK